MTTTKPKRKGLPKKEKKTSNLLFDFLDDITYKKQNILNDSNKHAYSRFMIARFLSMNEGFLPLVDVILNRHQAITTDEEFHKLCIGIFPKQKIFLKYNKGTALKKECKEQIKYIRDYFKVSEDEAFDYYQIAGDEFVNDIKRLYGVIE